MFSKLLEIKPLPNYTLWLKYDDGTEGEVNFNDCVGKGVFNDWNEISPFEKVYLTKRGIITWNENLDICPNSMCLKIRNLSLEDYKNII